MELRDCADGLLVRTAHSPREGSVLDIATDRSGRPVVWVDWPADDGEMAQITEHPAEDLDPVGGTAYARAYAEQISNVPSLPRSSEDARRAAEAAWLRDYGEELMRAVVLLRQDYYDRAADLEAAAEQASGEEALRLSDMAGDLVSRSMSCEDRRADLAEYLYGPRQR